MNSIPCGIPNILTYVSSCNKYFTGVAINNSKMYESPSKKAMILKMLNIVCSKFYGANIQFLLSIKDGSHLQQQS